MHSIYLVNASGVAAQGRVLAPFAASCVCRCLLSASCHGVRERAGPGARGRELWQNSGTVRFVGLNICLMLMIRARGTGLDGLCGPLRRQGPLA